MLKIENLTASEELDHKAMAGVSGGNGDLESAFALLDASTSLVNKVADVQQAFGFGIAQTNAGALTNNQAIQGGNGIVFAPVRQTLDQSNDLDVFDIGNTSVF